ncbi:MAG TPA: maleylpyruvate isomerase family mycothiol-dependent enzyme [Nocardioidaceae bacterium]|nr:maleylpyruvate isomerase family mycothiol-dependent enzyme [Nocardioidaceae bacterium]
MTSDAVTSDRERLSGYVASWRSAVDDVVALLRGLDDADWSRPTDLPGWDVRGVACHLAHIESDLAGVKQKRVEVPEGQHLTAPTSVFTEMGLVARADLSPAEIVDELEECARTRHAALLVDPPADGKADPPRTPGRIGWNWETLLDNRVVDVWMHEQDIRRALGRPGGFDGPAAAHTVAVFTRSFPYAVGKKVAPPAGTTVVLDVTGTSPVHLAVEVDDTGRASVLPADPESPTVSLRMDVETFVVLAGGRRAPEAVDVEVTGDTELARRLLEAMAVTP